MFQIKTTGAGCLIAAVAALCWGLPVAAHDYWLMPEKLVLPASESVKVHLYYGDDFKPENERPFQKDRTPSFQLISAKSTRDLTQLTPDRQLPLTTLDFAEPGSYLMVLDRNAQNIILKPKAFNKYLEHEGLTDILALRKQKKQLATQGRERYSRSIKSIVQVGEVAEPVVLGVLDKQIEIIPEQNPADLRPGQTLTLQVRFEGKPLANRLVNAYHTAGTRLTNLPARTDSDGRVSFRLDYGGPWLVRLVHMRACAQNCSKVDWESYWSSLTFALADLPKT